MASLLSTRNAVACENCRKDYPVQTKTFPIKTLAKAWAGRIEHNET